MRTLTTVTGLVAAILALTACAPNAYVSQESSKLLGTVIGSAIDPTMTRTQITELTKQCAAVQARISACNALGEGAAQCIANVKAQSPLSAKCVL
jgi:spermidine/putrescine-binding protein